MQFSEVTQINVPLPWSQAMHQADKGWHSA